MSSNGLSKIILAYEGGTRIQSSVICSKILPLFINWKNKYILIIVFNICHIAMWAISDVAKNHVEF